MAERPDDAPTHYQYETDQDARPSSVRRRSIATEEARVLLRRLGVPEEMVHCVDPLASCHPLIRYATDVPLNIAWYERAKRRETRRRARFWAVTTVFGTAVVVLPLLLLFVPGKGGAPGGAWAAQVGAILTGLIALLRFLTAAGDTSVRIGIFWQAAADLKDELLSLEDTWRGKPVITQQADGAPTLADTFLLALEESLKRAHVITRTERLAFFATWKAPGDLSSVALDRARDARRAHQEQLF